MTALLTRSRDHSQLRGVGVWALVLALLWAGTWQALHAVAHEHAHTFTFARALGQHHGSDEHLHEHDHDHAHHGSGDCESAPSWLDRLLGHVATDEACSDWKHVCDPHGAASAGLKALPPAEAVALASSVRGLPVAPRWTLAAARAPPGSGVAFHAV